MEGWWSIHVALCILGTALIYGPLLKAPLLYDDVAAVERNPDVNLPLTWSLFENDFWGTPLKSNFSHQSYRPLTVLTYRLTNNVFYQRLFNTILHVINTLLFTTLVQEKAGTRVARIAGVLFCFHPVQTETVIQLVGRAELLSAFFYLMCIFSSSYSIACVCTSLAMLCKEQGVTALAVKALLDIIHYHAGHKDKTLWKKLLIFTSATMGLLTTRFAISGGTPSFHEFDNPARQLASPLRQINFVYLALFNVKLLLNPYCQSCDYSFESIPLIESFFDKRVLYVTFFAATTLTVIASLFRSPVEKAMNGSGGDELKVPSCNSKRTNNPSHQHQFNNNNYIPCKITQEVTGAGISTQAALPLTALTMAFIPWLPASNLLFYVGFVVAERVLYLPAMGTCFLIAVGYGKIWALLPERSSSLLRNALVTFSCALLMKSAIRGQQWRSGVQLFGAAVRDYPGK